ncbi:LysE family translocator [Marinomonas aquiplantarum]|uniref:Threonine/homoserine/homoserine lactone efflux protein n=1 Tax=Marinomonas aquiplantarum TaxID=491951 RepID=A0A366D3J0_9GAMM|nr:LysE family translocator [Marinomonas aquiplantarum]RBO84014.1 threonine/homoserine/homoserine lactone efflux protein [Marinomonas aquiplantarum]
MDTSFFVALAMFAFITSVTPGPNNIMLLASGAQFGFRRTIPHMLGIVLGMSSLLLATLLGLGAVFSLYPPLYSVLQWLGCVYLLWLAWKIASAPVGRLESGELAAKPMSWWQAALFQYVNPKAWMMSLGCVSTFAIAGDDYLTSGMSILLAFACLGFIAISIWAWAGMKIRIWLTEPKRQRGFNYLMGLATALTLFMIIG